MNELIIIAIMMIIAIIPYICVRILANICWLIYANVYGGKTQRKIYVKKFIRNVI